MPSVHTFSHRRVRRVKRFGASEAPQHLRRGGTPERCVSHARAADANRRGDRYGLRHAGGGPKLVRLSGQCSAFARACVGLLVERVGGSSRAPKALRRPDRLKDRPARREYAPRYICGAATRLHHLRRRAPPHHYISGHASGRRNRASQRNPRPGSPAGQPSESHRANETPRRDDHGMGGEGSIEQLLTIGEAAEVLRTTPRFPRRLIAERRIRFVKVGRHVRIPESALVEFVAAGVVEPVIRHARRLVM